MGQCFNRECVGRFVYERNRETRGVLHGRSGMFDGVWGTREERAFDVYVKHLRATECLFKTLQFPWEESVAVLYGSFMHYVALEERKESGKCLPDFMTELIKRMKFLAQKGPLITALFRRYQGQRKEVEALVALKKGELNEQQ